MRAALKGALRPRENDSAYLLDVHSRGVPGRERMHRYPDSDEVDMLIVGCGAGGSVLAQRLARAGWRVVVLERGPFWDPDTDWVSDEEGSAHLYWNDKRIIGGSDPVEMGKNNSGHGVGGSMVHYAGYTPRFHPSDFDVGTRDGVAADWPISYWDLKPHFERVERELPVAGQDWPWGDRRRRRSGMGRGTRAWHRDAGRTGGDHQRRLRQPAALHLPWVLPARLQGERQSQPAGNSRPRRDRAWCRDPFRLDGGARRGRWVGALHGRHLPPRRP